MHAPVEESSYRSPVVSSLLRSDESLWIRARRRIGGITVEILAFVLLTALAPVVLLASVAVDSWLWLRRRKPWMAVRLVALLWWFLAVELRGLCGLGVLHLLTLGRGPMRDVRGEILRHKWLCRHFAGMRRIFGLRVEVDGLELATPGPTVVLMRHASTVDTLLPETVVIRDGGLSLRYVLKRELLMLPTIDIGRRWVTTAFLRRGSGSTAEELERLRAVATDLGPDEGVLIYPEGTLFSPAKLTRAQQAVARLQPAVADLAAQLRHVLPPKVAGTATLLKAAGPVDVVVLGHLGLDGFEYVRDLWGGGLVGSTVHVKFWRHAAASVPVDDVALARWIYQRWVELDEWVDAKRNPGAAEDLSPRGARVSQT